MSSFKIAKVPNEFDFILQVVAVSSRNPNKLVKRKRKDSPVEDWPWPKVLTKKQRVLEDLTKSDYFFKDLDLRGRLKLALLILSVGSIALFSV